MAECFWQNLVLTEEDCDVAEVVIPPWGDFIQRAELTGPGGIDYFGRYVAIDADTAIICYNTNIVPETPNIYAAVVYDNVDDVWTEGQTLSESQTMDVMQVAGDLAVFRTRESGYTYPNQGGVYVYQKSGGTWSKLQQIDAPNLDDNDIYVEDAALSPDGEWLAFGCDDSDGTEYVLMYEWNGSSFAYHSRIEAPGYGDNFGRAVSLSSAGVLAVGARSNDDAGSNDGIVYIYELSGASWSLGQSITPTVNESSTRFGESVRLSSDANYLAVGDALSGVSVYELDGTYGFVERIDHGAVGYANAKISDDGLTVIQPDNPFASDSTISVNEYDEGSFFENQNFSPDHPDLLTAWIAIYGMDLRDGQLIVGCAEHETGEGLVDGQGFVYIYSRDPI